MVPKIFLWDLDFFFFGKYSLKYVPVLTFLRIAVGFKKAFFVTISVDEVLTVFHSKPFGSCIINNGKGYGRAPIYTTEAQHRFAHRQRNIDISRVG